jgi:hypothetical protein
MGFEIYPSDAILLRNRMREISYFIFACIIITYWVGAVPNSWPLFEKNSVLYAALVVVAALAFHETVTKSVDSGLAITVTALSIAVMIMSPRPIVSLSLNMGLCTQISDQKSTDTLACINKFQSDKGDTNIPITDIHVACLKEQGIDIRSYGATDTCPFLSGSLGTFYVALMYIMSIFMFIANIYLFNIAYRLQEKITAKR